MKNNARVLLINPKFKFKGAIKKHSLFPFGLGYIAACLRQEGHQVDIWDLYSQPIDYQAVQAKIQSGFLQDYDHIGITGIISHYRYVKQLVHDIKSATRAVVTVGGPLASYSSHVLFQEMPVDLCVIGPGEETYCDVVAGKPWPEIPGLAFRSSPQESVIQTAPRGLVKDLDALPYPAYDLFDMEFYLSHAHVMDILRPEYRGAKVMPLLTGRGCPYNCKFCSKSIRSTKYKSVDYIMGEIQYFKEHYGVRLFHFLDELVVISKKRTLEFCEKIAPLQVAWDAQGRANLVDKEILVAMKASGCLGVGFGVESGSQTILTNMQKEITPDQIRNALTICRDIQFLTKIQLIFGYPGESDQTIAETLQLFKELRYPARRLNIITPLPGSPLYETAKTDGFIGEPGKGKITEAQYHDWLCGEKGPFCNSELVYNRTAFSDAEFFEKHRYIEHQLLWNFILEMLRHPLFFVKHWGIYKWYLLNWWTQRYQKQFPWLSRGWYALTHPKRVFAKLIGA